MRSPACLACTVLLAAGAEAQHADDRWEEWWLVRQQSLLRSREVARDVIMYRPLEENTFLHADRLPCGGLRPYEDSRLYATRHITAMLTRDESACVRGAILVALGEIGRIGEATIDDATAVALRESTRVSDPELRAAAVLGLGLFGAVTEDEVHLLETAADDAANEVAVLARHVLAVNSREGGPELRPRIVGFLIERATDCGSRSVRRCAAIEALGVCLPTEAVPLRQRVLSAFDAIGDRARAPGWGAERQLLPVARAALTWVPPPAERGCTPHLTAHLVAELRARLPETPLSALPSIETLLDGEYPRYPVDLHDRLDEAAGSDWVRGALVLAALGNFSIAEKAWQRLGATTDDGERCRLLATLGVIGDCRQLTPCLCLLRDGGSPAVRRAAIQAVGHIASLSDRPWHLPWSRFVDPFGPSPLLAIVQRRSLW